MNDPQGHPGKSGDVTLSDGGLQVERTSLAWQRTECALVVCALAGVRVTAALGQGYLAVLLSVPALGFTAAGLLGSIRPRQRLAVTDDGLIFWCASVGFRALLMSLLASVLGLACLVIMLEAGADGLAVVGH
ncbi:DUF202 domain-containing protein [Nocardia vinacea]|uniref:DUF202 domain-containing protein n=1 Tax=Nocardia vinacea TaxID=96468 RepID=UPI003408B3CF